MNFGLNKYYNTVSFDYVNNIISRIHRSIIDAANKNNIEAFNELLDFMQYTLLGKSYNVSINEYSKVATTLIYIYPNLKGEFKNIFLDRIFTSLNMKIRFSEGDNNIDNKYIELSYLPIINITKLILQHDDYESFNIIYKKIQDSLFSIDIEKEQSNYLFKFLTTLLCWIYYLKFTNNISFNSYDVNYFEQNFQHITVNFDEIFLNDFFNLFDEIDKGLWAVSDWEIKEPPQNKAYFALMPSSWLPFSLTLLLLRFNHLINLNDDLTKIRLLSRFRHFFDDIKKILDEITTDKPEYREFIFNNIQSEDLEKQLSYKKEKILNVFAYLKKEVEIDDYKTIREVQLSEKRITDFRNNVGELWEKNLLIINILKHLNKIKYLPNNEDIKGYGFFQTLLKMRFAFIEGKHYQQVIGLNDFGSMLAREVDNQFFQNLRRIKEPVSTENLSKSIDNFIASSTEQKNIVIFANWRAEEKIGNTIYHHEKLFPFSYKSYNGIPIINSHNHFTKLIFIVDFSNIDIEIYTSEKSSWYKNELLIEVTEYQKEKITEDKIKEWNEKEGYNYNEEEVDILESNNINIKILFKHQYLINEESQFLILNISDV